MRKINSISAADSGHAGEAGRDRADVLVENFRTGVLDRRGLSFGTLQERRPRLVVLSITGLGHDGPASGRPGYDQIAQGEVAVGNGTLDEVYAWDQTASQGLLIDVEHPTLGTVTLPGPPLRFFAPDGQETTPREHAPPPTLDQHRSTIARWLATDS